MATSVATSMQAPVFHPTVWGEYFINFTPKPLQISDEKMAKRIKELKEEVNAMFQSSKNVVEKLNLVDVVQRLGIDHHFDEQIATALASIHSSDFNSSSLHEVGLRFRLLRQQGFWVSADEFDKFKNEDGSFINGIENDPKGLLSLYNAAHLLTYGEGTLDDAILFSRRHLEAMRSSLKPPFADQVGRALEIPLPRTLKREEAISFISEYSSVQDQTYSPAILELAKLDFNLLQRLHQKELKALTQWWKDLSREIGLDYVRDRIVEYDTYDVHATLDEARELTKAIERWDEGDISLLPEYLKKFFVKVVSSFREFEDELEPHEKYRNAYNRKGFQTLSKGYLQEAEWFHQGYTPSFKEQVNVSVITAGGQVLSIGLLVGMGDIATKEAFEWIIGSADAVWACGEVSRFMDDMSAFKNGRNKFDVASTVECYIKEHNVSSEVALTKIGSFVEDAWKTINQAPFKYPALLPVVQRVTSLARSMTLLFLDKRDAYTYSKDFKRTLERHFVKHILI
ncbi:unnamed protein product [Urochloa humidicola]